MYIEISEKHFYNIVDEESLQRSVVKYLRSCDLLFSSSLGGTLDTIEKRLNSHLNGYQKGTPDLIIYTPCSGYAGMAIEFKTPWGNGSISKEQKNWCDTLEKECNYLVVVSNNFVEIIEIIVKYVNGVA